MLPWVTKLMCQSHGFRRGRSQVKRQNLRLVAPYIVGESFGELGAFVGASRRSLALFERSELATDTGERQGIPTVPLLVKSERGARPRPEVRNACC